MKLDSLTNNLPKWETVGGASAIAGTISLIFTLIADHNQTKCFNHRNAYEIGCPTCEKEKSDDNRLSFLIIVTLTFTVACFSANIWGSRKRAFTWYRGA